MPDKMSKNMFDNTEAGLRLQKIIEEVTGSGERIRCVAIALMLNNYSQFNLILNVLLAGTSSIFLADSILHPYIEYCLRYIAQINTYNKLRIYPKVKKFLRPEERLSNAADASIKGMRESGIETIMELLKVFCTQVVNASLDQHREAEEQIQQAFKFGNIISPLSDVNTERNQNGIMMEPPPEIRNVLILRDIDFVMEGGKLPEGQSIIDICYMIKNFRNGVYLLLHDPAVELPRLFQQAFPLTVSISPLNKDIMWNYLTGSRARTGLKAEYKNDEKAKMSLWQVASHLNIFEFCELLNAWEQVNTNSGNIPENIPEFITRYHPSLEDRITPVTENMIGGYFETRKFLKEHIIFPFRKWNEEDPSHRKKRQKYFRCITRGICFEGSQGNGKTYLARWLASETRAHLQVVNAADIRSKFVGDSEANIRDIFAKARSRSPSIIVFDEFDAIAAKRRSDPSSRVDNTIVNTLLTEMSGLKTLNTDELVIVITTTNRWEDIDESIKYRPERIGEIITLSNPTLKDLDDREIEGRKENGLLSVMIEKYEALKDLVIDPGDREKGKTDIAAIFRNVLANYCTGEYLNFSCDEIRYLFQILERDVIMKEITTISEKEFEKKIKENIDALNRRKNANVYERIAF